MIDKIYGNIGEAQAQHYLQTLGYDIVGANYRNYIGEIDIIALDRNILVFVEVKARNSAKFGLPREAVTYRKQQKIRTVASVFLQTTSIKYSGCRFDVIEILDSKLTHIKNAF